LKTVGIICECNPLHAGHLYLIGKARASGADCILCVMSGPFVQRGEAAIVDAYARAEILVRAGADAVLELPMPYAASSAEFFGSAGVEIVARLGASELWFGSETGETASLLALSELAESDAFLATYRERCASGAGTAEAYFATLSEMSDGHAELSPNDILALSYLRAIRRVGGIVRPVAIKRTGSGYGDRELTEGKYPSATALRLLWEREGLDMCLPHLPTVSHEILQRETLACRAPASLARAERLILGTLRLADAEQLSSFAGLGGGLAGLLLHASRKSESLSELLSRAATKTYTDASVRRAILYAMLGITEKDLRSPVSYVRLLAANEKGCAHLSRIRRETTLPVITRRGDVPRTEAARRQSLIEERALRLYSLMLPRAETEKRLLCHPPTVL